MYTKHSEGMIHIDPKYKTVNMKKSGTFQRKFVYFVFLLADGLRILAFPCNQFGKQEPGTNEEIKQFAAKYNVEFDMFDKCNVNGSLTHPIWTFLKEKQGGTLGNFIKWNFTKFVVDKEGQPVARYSPKDDPMPQVLEKCKALF